MSSYIAPDEDEAAMRKARDRLIARGVQLGPTTRKKREKKIRTTVDGRSLAVTGRTEQFNVRVRSDIKRLVVETAKERGCTIAELMEAIVIEALGEPTQ